MIKKLGKSLDEIFWENFDTLACGIYLSLLVAVNFLVDHYVIEPRPTKGTEAWTTGLLQGIFAYMSLVGPTIRLVKNSIILLIRAGRDIKNEWNGAGGEGE